MSAEFGPEEPCPDCDGDPRDRFELHADGCRRIQTCGQTDNVSPLHPDSDYVPAGGSWNPGHLERHLREHPDHSPEVPR